MLQKKPSENDTAAAFWGLLKILLECLAFFLHFADLLFQLCDLLLSLLNLTERVIALLRGEGELALHFCRLLLHCAVACSEAQRECACVFAGCAAGAAAEHFEHKLCPCEVVPLCHRHAWILKTEAAVAEELHVCWGCIGAGFVCGAAE